MTTSGPALRLYTAPASEPITAALVKTAAAIDSDLTTWDGLIDIAISAARRDAEHRTGRKLITQTWDVLIDAFPVSEIELPLAPVSAITSINYIDAAGVTQTLASASYLLDNSDEARPFVLLASGYTWPTTLDTANAVQIRVTAGYGTAADVPENVRQWMILQAAASLPQSDIKMTPYVDALLDGVRIWVP